MQTSKKIIVGLVLSLSVFAGSSVVHASYNWKDFFSFNEMSSIKKATNTSIINNLKTSSDWKNVIGGRNIKNDAITSDKIKDGTIVGADLASNIGITTTGDLSVGVGSNSTITLGDDTMADTLNIRGLTDIAAHYWGVTQEGFGSFNGGLEVNGVDGGYVDFSGAASMTIPRGNGAPTSGDCDSASEIGRMYINTASGGNLYTCTNKQGSVGWDTVNLTD